MTTSRLIEATAAAAYARGADPLSVAESITIVLIEDTMNVDIGDPRAVLLARRIAGAMLDAGWSPPSVTRKDTDYEWVVEARARDLLGLEP